MRFLLIILVTTLHISFLHAEESAFKLTLGSNLGNIPLEINKMSKNIKTLGGLQINSWVLSPNFSSFLGNKKSSIFLKKKRDTKEKNNLFIKLNFKF
jgi:hypothetical protein